ncbi:hypothetical protein [Alicyclobacillus sendaiensis]|nr:hypothetical protein [Alicyclobacillus sendaiensis]
MLPEAKRRGSSVRAQRDGARTRHAAKEGRPLPQRGTADALRAEGTGELCRRFALNRSS